MAGSDEAVRYWLRRLAGDPDPESEPVPAGAGVGKHLSGPPANKAMRGPRRTKGRSG